MVEYVVADLNHIIILVEEDTDEKTQIKASKISSEECPIIKCRLRRNGTCSGMNSRSGTAYVTTTDLTAIQKMNMANCNPTERR